MPKTSRGGRRGGGGPGGSAAKQTATPTDYKGLMAVPQAQRYAAFMQMSEADRYEVVGRIQADRSQQVPAYLDKSWTTKVMYTLGMDGKPDIVSDKALDSMRGKELFRTVYDAPGIKAIDIADQIKTGDYTQLSGSGGSAHGRALYFADNYGGSASYSQYYGDNAIMRAKVKSTAKLANERDMLNTMRNDQTYLNSKIYKTGMTSNYRHDERALYAIVKGYDGWVARNGYHMILNRNALTFSSTTKDPMHSNKSGKGYRAFDWNEAVDIK